MRALVSICDIGVSSQRPNQPRTILAGPLSKNRDVLDVANQIVVLPSSTVSGQVAGQVAMMDGGMKGTLVILLWSSHTWLLFTNA